MIKIDIFDKINNKLIVSFIKQILHRCSCKVRCTDGEYTSVCRFGFFYF